MSARVLYQTLVNFSVRIEDGLGQPRGTGIIVTERGHIVTCAHVVTLAGLDPKRPREGEVSVYFPRLRQRRRAVVAACFLEYEDDIVLLELLDPPLFGGEHVAQLGDAEESFGNRFITFGFRSLGDRSGFHGSGDILGPVPIPEDSQFMAEEVQIRSQDIDHGMSGSAVLDSTRNLVVGLVSQRADPQLSGRDRDTALAVNTGLLAAEPFNLPIIDGELPLGAAPTVRAPAIVAIPARGILAARLDAAPAPLGGEWVGRRELLFGLTEELINGQIRAVGLVGFGGEGKSSVARRWVDLVLQNASGPKFDGVFWWDFYKRPSAEEFISSAWRYIAGAHSDNIASSPAAQVLMLAAHCIDHPFLFILDGVEVMQHQQADTYGMIQSESLRLFITSTSGAGKSFCVLTSRVPVVELMHYATYRHFDVSRLSSAEGELLLRQHGVVGTGDLLTRIVENWGGHALSLSLLASYVVTYRGGQAAAVTDMPVPEGHANQLHLVDKVLSQYDQLLSDAERSFLVQASLFRTALRRKAFGFMRRMVSDYDVLGAQLSDVSNKQFEILVQRLVSYRLIGHDPVSNQYWAHPLVRAHYLDHSVDLEHSVRLAHIRLRRYFLEIGGPPATRPSLAELSPFIEAVYHSCQAWWYDDAWSIYSVWLMQGDREVIVQQLGAFETILGIMKDFFPDAEMKGDPAVSFTRTKANILSTVGFCLQNLGRLAEVAEFYNRCIEIDLAREDFDNSTINSINFTNLYVLQGELHQALRSANQAVEYAIQSDDARNLCRAYGSKAWVQHLRGEIKLAQETFQTAENLEIGTGGGRVETLVGQRGLRYAEHLHRTGNNMASWVIAQNLAYSERHSLTDHLSRGRRVYGDLVWGEAPGDAAGSYDEAVRLARNTSHRISLIEALVSRGRFFARAGDAELSQVDLEEARQYIIGGGYRLHEVDLRVAMGWLQLARNEMSLARQDAELAGKISVRLNYHWGQVDSEELLHAL